MTASSSLLEREYRFGSFTLLPGQRRLLNAGQPVPLGSRAFDLLVALAERAGEVVPGNELMAQVWQNTVVEPGSLRVHLAGLRKALGDGRDGRRYITNLPSRGYALVAPVDSAMVSRETSPHAADGGHAAAAPRPAGLPIAHPLLGRDDAIAEIVERLSRQRCLTVVGPGGMGKTVVAIAVADQLYARYPQGTVWLDLAPVGDGRQVPSALASALGISVDPTSPLDALGTFLRDKRLLLVLDNCEHLVDRVAELAEHLLRTSAGLQILATSREPLRIEGEWVQRLEPLRAPATDRAVGTSEAIAFPAVQLFVERAAASHDGFVFDDTAVEPVAEICRRLDGIPLAIELAAASAGALGVQTVATHLGERLTLLTHGRRTALPRQQTLRATLDWSYALLSHCEQRTWLRLAVFRAPFTLDAAIAVCRGEETLRSDAASVSGDVFNLVDKSMLTADTTGESVHFRMLESARAYALETLGRNGELARVERMHALHLHELFREAGVRSAQPVQWLERHARRIDDLRAAIAWAFAPAGDSRIGIALAANTAPLWFSLSLMAEYRQIAEQALATLATLEQGDAELEMRLQEAHGHALWHTRGSGPAMAAAFGRALAVAETRGAIDYQLRATWGLWLICNTSGDYPGSARLARRFGEIAGPSPPADVAVTHDRMMALGLHFHGEQAAALQHASRVLEHPSTVNHTARNSGFQFDQRISALTVMSRILWITGHTAQALAHAHAAVDEALRIDHTLSLCYSIANGAAPVAFWAGDRDTAARWTELLYARAAERSLPFWMAFAQGFRLLLAQPARDGRTRSLASAEALHGPAVGNLLRETLCTVDRSLAEPALLARAIGDPGSWCAPEMLRVRALQVLDEGDLGAAQGLLQRALTLARSQQALAWELRCACTMAELHNERAGGSAALETLASVLDLFAPDDPGVDVAAARELVARLGSLS